MLRPLSGRQSSLDHGLHRRLVMLMGARVGIAVVSLGVALGIEAVGDEFTTAEWRGFYATVAFAFSTTVIAGLILHRVIHPQRFAALNVATDIVIVTALVYFSGGNDSAFSFLYLLVTASAALLFDERGALATAMVAIGAFGAVLVATHLAWLPSLAIVPAESVGTLLATWIVTSGGILVVATLASLLTAELRRTGEALDARTSDLERLLTLHQRTVESLMSGLLTTNERLEITSFNPEAVRITGFSAAEALGAPVEAVLPGVSAIASAAAEEADAANLRTRMPYRNRKGEPMHLGLAVYRLMEEARASGGFVVIFQDVTSVVAMENDLRRSERLAAIGELSASIAHEVRNPLAAISGSIQILRDQVDAATRTEERTHLMGIVLRETDRLNRLITDFLRYARPGPAVFESVDVSAVVEDVMKMFETIQPGGIEWEVEIPAGIRVQADPSKLHQVLWNLVLNAAEAMPDGGAMRISAAMVGGEPSQETANSDRKVAGDQSKTGSVEIVVSDNGVGVQPETLERLFDPFFTTKDDGSGLGLAAVHQIVEEHGGVVRLESHPGKGTTVRIRFSQAGVAS